METPHTFPSEAQLDDDEPVSVRPSSPEALARFDAALAAAPRALMEALEEAERFDRLAQERYRV